MTDKNKPLESTEPKALVIHDVVVAKRTFLNHIVDANKKVAFKNAPQLAKHKGCRCAAYT